MPGGHRKYCVHPLRAIFRLRCFTVCEGMNWLQERGLVSDECVWPEDVAPSDVDRVLQMAREKLPLWNF